MRFILFYETDVRKVKIMHLDRLITVLETVASAGRAVSPADVQRATGIPRPTCYRLLQTLSEHRLLDDPDGNEVNLRNADEPPEFGVVAAVPPQPPARTVATITIRGPEGQHRTSNTIDIVSFVDGLGR